MRASKILVLLAAGLLAACATGPVPSADMAPAAATEAVKVRVTVTRDGPDWRADYVLDRDAPAWAFYNSSRVMKTREPWRPRDWSVVTPGVVLQRVGELDVLRAADGGDVPRAFSLRLTPRGDNLEADYPVLLFTDGSVALFAGAFDIFALDRADAAGLSAAEIAASQKAGMNAHVTWKDRAGPVLVHGQRVATATTDDGGTYVLFGEARIKEASRVVTVADPQLPGWIAASIERFSPEVVDHYAARLGKGQTDRPMVMASWYGPSEEIMSYGGSVLPGLIVMSFEGKTLLDANDTVLAGIRWFIAHEVAHFWLGQTVHAENPDESWITEGGADLMAVRATKALDPAFDDLAMLQAEVDDCVTLGVKPVAGAGQRGEHRSYYACGSVLALAAEGLQRRATGGDWFDVLKPLINAHRKEGVLTRAAWLAHLSALGASPKLTAQIDAFLSAGAKNPAATIRSLFDQTGVAYRMDKGRIVLTAPKA
ncbi:MAG: M1 family aminopeptidase [Micropepsaceae bacterium]